MDLFDDVESVLDHKGHHIWFIGPEASVFDAIRYMSDKDVGALLVIDDDEILGVISERDYTRKVILKDRSSRETKVREIMTPNVVSVSPNATIEEAMRLMTRNRFRHLPVVRDGRLIGVVSMGDLVERTISNQRAILAQLEGYIIGRYPG